MSEKKKSISCFVVTALLIAAGAGLLLLYETYHSDSIGKGPEWMGYLSLLLFAAASISFIFGMWFAFHNKKATIFLCVSFAFAVVVFFVICTTMLFSSSFSSFIDNIIFIIICAFASFICFLIGIGIAIGDYRRGDKAK